jgi:hypothetical protein
MGGTDLGNRSENAKEPDQFREPIGGAMPRVRVADLERMSRSAQPSPEASRYVELGPEAALVLGALATRWGVHRGEALRRALAAVAIAAGLAPGRDVK